VIAKTREDERERAGIEQTVPSYEYPFTTAVTVRQVMPEMTYMQRWSKSYGHAYQGMTGDRSDMIQNPEGEWVRLSDVESTIEALEEKLSQFQQHEGCDAAGLAEGYDRGQQEMLAKCISVVQEVVNNRIHDFATCSKDDDCASFVYPADIMGDDILSALNSLQERAAIKGDQS